MATIELYKSKINNMSNILGNVKAEVSSYALGLASLSSQLLTVDSPALDKAISSLSTASKVQEQQITGLNAQQKIIDIFVFNAQRIDNKVAGCIRDLQKMYDAVYNYRHSDKYGIKTDTLAEYLYKTWSDRFTQGYNAYNSKDLKNMSQEEFEEYVNQLLSIDENNLTEEDKTKIQAVLDYLSGVNVTNNMSETDKKKITQYNSLYEKINVDDGIRLRNLFKDTPNEYKEDIEYIKYIAYSSTGECHDVFFKYADQLKIADYYATYNGKDRNYFSQSDMSMHINIKKMRDSNNSYGAFFHEAGHNIDLLMGIDKTGEKNYYSSTGLANGDFHNIVYQDVETVVKNVVNNYSNNEKHLSDYEKKLITDILMGRKLDSEIKNSNTDFSYRKVLEDITGAWKGKYSRQYQTGKETGILEETNSSMLSEVMNGMTNNSLMVDKYNYNKFWGIDHGTSGHPINWQNSDPNAGDVQQDYYYNSDGSYTGSAETEYMAEYMRINMTNRTSEKEYVNKYLNNSWEVMRKGLSDE